MTAPVSVDDYAAAAARVLPRPVRDFIDGGSGAELTMAANRAALDRVAVVPRVLTGAAEPATATDLAGARAELPLAVAPMAYQRLVHPDGETAVAAAAAAAGVPFTVSTFSSVPVEELTALGGVTWFQLYWLRGARAVVRLVRRAEDAGCAALMVTVDVPEMARRPRDLRNGFTLPDGVRAAHLDEPVPGRAHRHGAGRSAVGEHTKEILDPRCDWDDLRRLRQLTRLPLIVKGILDHRDAVRAADLGANAVVISNHGGRQLDGAAATADMLPAACDALAGRCPLLLDSGIRSGTDVLKALALGAQGVLLGRPVLWGLATGGQDGVRGVLDLVDRELRCALTLAGCSDAAAARRLRVSGRDGDRKGVPA
ncbi:alpha-hydroxy acid oxidase [Streptomyces sp. NPDC051162]|uniref:alpha-hydroxy acid oxidase n=1 Tax=Streptomyces sp. NPDC051162 TaxID=3154747 RepID=UPI003437DAC1